MAYIKKMKKMEMLVERLEKRVAELEAEKGITPPPTPPSKNDEPDKDDFWKNVEWIEKRLGEAEVTLFALEKKMGLA